jgi:hypothetical protein
MGVYRKEEWEARANFFYKKAAKQISRAERKRKRKEA